MEAVKDDKMATDAEKPESSPDAQLDNSPETGSARFDKDSDDEPVAWTAEAERRTIRKVDFSVLPLLFLGLLVFQLDRMNGRYPPAR